MVSDFWLELFFYVITFVFLFVTSHPNPKKVRQKTRKNEIRFSSTHTHEKNEDWEMLQTRMHCCWGRTFQTYYRRKSLSCNHDQKTPNRSGGPIFSLHIVSTLFTWLHIGPHCECKQLSLMKSSMPKRIYNCKYKDLPPSIYLPRNAPERQICQLK